MDLKEAIAIVKKGEPRPFSLEAMTPWYDAKDAVTKALLRHHPLLDALLALECPTPKVEAFHA